MIINFNKYKLFENPDAIIDPRDGEEYSYYKTLPFSYYYTYDDELKFFISDEYEDTHNDLLNSDEDIIIDDLLNSDKYIEGRGPLSGRLYIRNKIITFWDFPKNQQKLKKIGDDIKKESGEDIYEGGWLVEVPKNDDEIDLNWKGIEPDVDVYFVPVEDYNHYRKRSKKELETPHLMSDKDKRKILWKSKKSDWKKHLKPFESLDNKLFENPNLIFDPKTKEKKRWSEKKGDKYVFSYYPTKIKMKNEDEYKFFIRKNGDHHILQTINSDEIDYLVDPQARGKLSGRIFFNEKIITFWDFPKDQQELKKVANDIKYEYDIDIYEGNWLVEILAHKDVEWDVWGTPNENDSVFVSVEKYNGSIKRSDRELSTPHLMSDKEKKELLWQSKKSNWKKHMKPFESFNSIFF